MLGYEADIRAELVADDRSGGGHAGFTETVDNHSKHEVCAQDKTIIAAALEGRFEPGSKGWDELPCDMMHQRLPAGCEQNVEPGLPRGYQPVIPGDPENTTEPGFMLLGFGACRTQDQRYPPWGGSGGSNKECAANCTALFGPRF